MKITKLGHSCMVVEESGVRILIDPGAYSMAQDSVMYIDVVLITHEHQDHVSIESLKKVLANNPRAKLFTSSGVGTLLDKEGIAWTSLAAGESVTEKGVLIEGFGNDHALIHSTIPVIRNTGYFIANRFFYPGDAFVNPGKPIEILALPVAAPWMRLAEAIDYAAELKPKVAFPVHDGMLKIVTPAHRIPEQILTPQGIAFKVLELEKEYEF